MSAPSLRRQRGTRAAVAGLLMLCAAPALLSAQQRLQGLPADRLVAALRKYFRM